MLPQYKSQYICVLGMQITQSAQSVQITEYTCRQPHVGVFVQLLPRPACFGDYSYKYHLTTNTVGTTAGTTGTCGDGEIESSSGAELRSPARHKWSKGTKNQFSPTLTSSSSKQWRLASSVARVFSLGLLFVLPLSLIT